MVTGCNNINGDNRRSEDYMTNEYLINFYNDNKGLINRIKDGLFTSGFDPTENESGDSDNLVLYYDYKENRIFCQDDRRGKKFKYIEKFESDVIDYFQKLNDEAEPEICFREIYGDIVVEIAFRIKSNNVDYRRGIRYTTIPDEFGYVYEHLEDNWYMFEYSYNY